MNFDLKTVAGLVAMGAVLAVVFKFVSAKNGLIVGAVGLAGVAFLPSSSTPAGS